MATIVQVVGSPTSLTGGDDMINQRLVALGHTVTLRDDIDAVLADNLFDAFIICPSCSSTVVNNKYATSTKPGLILDEAVVDDHNMVGTLTTASVTGWTVTGSGAPAGGYSGALTVYSAATVQNGCTVSTLGAGAVVVATRAGSADSATYFYYPAGGALVGGGTAPAKRIAFLLVNGGEATLNADGRALFDAAVTFALAGAGGPVSLAGASGAVGAASGSLARARPLAGASGAAAQAVASLGRERPLGSTVGAAAGASGTPAVERVLAGAAAAVSGASGSLAVLGGGQFQGAAGAASGASGSLVVARPLAGAVGAVSAASAALLTQAPGSDNFGGESRAASGASGSLAVARALIGEAAAAAGADAALNIVGFPPPIADPLPPRSAGWRPRPTRRRTSAAPVS